MEFIVQDCENLTALQRLLLKEALVSNLEIALESYNIEMEDRQVRVVIKEVSTPVSPHTPPSLPPHSPQSPPSGSNIKDLDGKPEWFHVPEALMQALIVQEQYPKEVITEVAKDAWILFLGSDNKDKKWARFLAHYFRNEKGKIREFLTNKSKSESKQYDELSANDILKLLEGEG